MLGATDIVENSDKEKWVNSGYGIGFDGKGMESFIKGWYIRYIGEGAGGFLRGP